MPAVLAVLTLLFMLPFLRPPTGSEVFDGHDLLYQQYPLYSFIFDRVRDGAGLPLWNPYLFSGQSIVANPQSTIFYPPAWIMALVGVPRGVGWLVVLHLWLGGWGMAQFTRRLGASPVGALAGGIIYEFSGLMAAHLNAGHINYLLCAAWLPWLAAAYLWSVERPNRLLAALPGAAVLGLAILSGHPPQLYFGLLWLAALWVYLVVTKRAAPLPALRPLVVIAVGGAALGAALLLPVADFTLRSTRTQGSLGFSGSYALPGAQLLTLLIPNLFGEPNQGYWGLPFYEELTAYLGILPLLVPFLVRRRPAAVLLMVFMAVGLVVSLGIDGGLFPFLYYLLPGYNLFRVPPRALYFFTVGAAGLVALLITDWQTATPDLNRDLYRTVRRALLVLVVLLVIAAFALSAFFTAHSTSETPPYRILQSASATALAALVAGAVWLVLRWRASGTGAAGWQIALVIAVLLVDLWRVSAPLVTVSAVDVPVMWQVMARVAPSEPDFRVMTIPNQVIWQAGAVYTRHLNAGGYDPLVSETYQRLLDASDYNPTAPIARLLGVRYAISDKPFDWSGLPGGESLTLLAQDGNWYVYEMADPLPRVFIVPAARVMPDDETARQEMTASTFDPLALALISQPANCPTSDGNAAARITGYNPDAVLIETRSDQPGMLVLTDSYDPNWTVTIDDAPAEMLRVYTALRGVCLPAGEHRVRFEYQPRAFYLGVTISAAAWLGLAFIGLARLAQHLLSNRRINPA